MASNIVSRFLQPAVGEPSIYETLAQQEDESDQSAIEERVSISLDEENLGTGFRDYELDDALADAAASQAASATPRGTNRQKSAREPRGANDRAQALHSRANLDDLDDEVPHSLLIEDEHDAPPVPAARQKQSLPPPIPGPTSRRTQARWQAVQEQQQLYQDTLPRQAQPRIQHHRGHPMSMMDPKERALWMWANVENLDNFLQDVYDYFLGNGIWSILLSRLLNLL